jgi:hypothetical protein
MMNSTIYISGKRDNKEDKKVCKSNTKVTEMRIGYRWLLRGIRPINTVGLYRRNKLSNMNTFNGCQEDTQAIQLLQNKAWKQHGKLYNTAALCYIDVSPC